VANDYGLIYTGTIVKAIIDLLSTQFGGLSSSAIGNEILDTKIQEVITQYFAKQTLKKCPNYQSENRMMLNIVTVVVTSFYDNL
jgi:hypothetical protein